MKFRFRAALLAALIAAPLVAQCHDRFGNPTACPAPGVVNGVGRALFGPQPSAMPLPNTAYLYSTPQPSGCSASYGCSGMTYSAAPSGCSASTVYIVPAAPPPQPAAAVPKTVPEVPPASAAPPSASKAPTADASAGVVINGWVAEWGPTPEPERCVALYVNEKQLGAWDYDAKVWRPYYTRDGKGEFGPPAPESPVPPPPRSYSVALANQAGEQWIAAAKETIRRRHDEAKALAAKRPGPEVPANASPEPFDGAKQLAAGPGQAPGG